MSKIYKISAYVVDYREAFSDEEDLEDYLFCRTQNDIILDHIKIDSADIGMWYDDHPLNYSDCDIETYERYFED